MWLLCHLIDTFDFFNNAFFHLNIELRNLIKTVNALIMFHNYVTKINLLLLKIVVIFSMLYLLFNRKKKKISIKKSMIERQYYIIFRFTVSSKIEFLREL